MKNAKIVCEDCGKVLVTIEEYKRKMNEFVDDNGDFDYIGFEMWEESVKPDHFLHSCPQAEEVIKRDEDEMNEILEREIKYEKLCEDFKKMKTIQKVFSENKNKLPFSYKTFERKYLKDEKIINEMLKLNLILISQGNVRRTIKVYDDKEIIKFILKLK